jgi:diguanylate cyclase
VAFIPSIVAMATQRASLDEWTLLLMVMVFSAVVGSMGLIVITACLSLIYEQNKALHAVSHEDDLTGLFRRRYWHELASQQLHRLELTGQPATLLYLDLDGFKAINDSFGHNVGDDVLRATADALRTVVPSDAITGRPGGDEFIALLPRARVPQAQAVARRLREHLRQADFPVHGVRASIGIAAWSAGESLADLIDRADQAMLREKGDTRQRGFALVTERPIEHAREPIDISIR